MILITIAVKTIMVIRVMILTLTLIVNNEKKMTVIRIKVINITNNRKYEEKWTYLDSHKSQPSWICVGTNSPV